MTNIINQAASRYNLTAFDLKKRTRYQPTAEARQYAMYMLRKQGYKLQQIADWFGMHHSSVSHACKVIALRLEMDQLLDV